MPETIKFRLGARLAIIRKPDSNETYYTYNLPHKIMLYGMLGAIIGLNGYNSESFIRSIKKEKEQLPDFYTKLKNIRIGIIPNFGEKGFDKKIQSFNNSVGYASQEEGNNLIVAEQILENPSWNIYILDNNSEEYQKIKDYLLNRKCEYIPYIGKNDYFANISKVEIFEAKDAKITTNLDSIFEEDILKGYVNDYMTVLAFDDDAKLEYEFSEVLPTELDLKLGYTNYKKFIYTNKDFEVKENTKIYEVNGKKIYYF